jgi:flagellar protein FlgJ
MIVPAPEFAATASALDAIRAQARNDPNGALRGAAQQFEAQFLGMLLQSMRATTSQGTPFDSEQTRLYQSLLDQQLAQTMAVRGVGLADIMARQLGAAQAPRQAETSSPPQAFVQRLWPHALEAGRATGLPARFILAQAALESGWGRSEPRGASGAPSYNLFGIKAGPEWSGRVAEAPTTEYVNGAARPTVGRFRAYGSYREAFADYARLLRSHPRYAQVLSQRDDAAGFAKGLQQAGYASDPMYADKLLRVINGAALRGALAT